MRGNGVRPVCVSPSAAPSFALSLSLALFQALSLALSLVLSLSFDGGLAPMDSFFLFLFFLSAPIILGRVPF